MVKTALLCLALTIYAEARGEPEKGQYAVAEVVMNRANERNLTVCQVINEKGQFSWVPNWNGKIPKGYAWDKSVTIAEATLNGKTTHYSNDATYFRHKGIKGRVPSPTVIGNHIFYRMASK